MTEKSNPIETDQLEDLNPPPPVEHIDEIEPAVDVLWNGRSGKVALAPGATVIRNHQVIGSGEACIEPGCAGKNHVDHQFHLRLSKTDGKWHGPDAGHYEDLIALGVIKNTPQAAERIAKEIEIANVRGVTPSDRCTNCKEPIERNAAGELRPICARCGSRNGLPELKPRTTAEIRRQWARDLQGGEAGIKAREQEALRSESKLLRDAVKEGNSELVSALAAILADRKEK